MLSIYFGDRKSNNSTISPQESKDDFSIAWDYLAGRYYCLVIYDIDTADCLTNFLAMNILANDVMGADILIAYKIPRVKTKDSHTFIVDLYLQKEEIEDFDKIKEMNLEDRYCSKAENFIFEANIELVERTTFVLGS